jgi:hypothetical protein
LVYFSHFGKLYQEKSGNPDFCHKKADQGKVTKLANVSPFGRLFDPGQCALNSDLFLTESSSFKFVKKLEGFWYDIRRLF